MPKRERVLRKKGRRKKKDSAKVASPNKLPKENSAQLIDGLLQKAEADIDSFNYESAINHCHSARDLDPENVKVLEMLAGILMETCELEEAENVYLRCVELCPDEGYSKYLSLGQISQGKKSLEFYEKGIAIIEKMLENSENTEPEAAAQTSPAMNRVLSDVLCSVAELFITDLCDEEDAESSCENTIQRAIKVDESNPEAYQSLANLRLIQENVEEAKSLMSKSLSLWLPQSLQEDTSPEMEICTPDIDCRIKTSQLLIELTMFEEATQVLERLLEENDQIFTIWYLLGWANYIHGEIYKENARYYFKKAKEIGKKYGCHDADQMMHVEEILQELQSEVVSGDESDGGDNEEFDPSSSESEMES